MTNTGAEISMPDETAASILQNMFQKDKAKVVPVENNRSVFYLLAANVGCSNCVYLRFNLLVSFYSK